MQSLRKLHAELQRTGASGADSAPPLTWLFDCGGMPSDSQLDAFATYGQGIAPEKVSSGCGSSTCSASFTTVLHQCLPSLSSRRPVRLQYALLWEASQAPL